MQEFRHLVSLEDAKKTVESLQVSHQLETVPLENGHGRICGADIYSRVDIPPFDRASMDGYGVHAEDTYTAREDRPVELSLVGSITPGRIPELSLERGEAVEIATGAVIPVGVDAVVMVEHTTQHGGVVRVKRPVAVGENIMSAGSDFMTGELLLEAGEKLTSREMGVLAAAGVPEVTVRLVRVGIISTGDELTPPTRELKPGCIYDVNTYSLTGAIEEAGGRPIIYGCTPDREDEIRKQILKAVEECDIVLTSGSTSAGSGDVVYKIIREIGEVLVHGVNVKPGKPVVIGVVREKPVIGLPGYPTSALTIFRELVSPLIHRALGLKPGQDKQVQARLTVDVRSERHQFLPVGLIRGRAYPILKGSGAITTLAEADGFIEIPSRVEYLPQGTEVQVTLLGEAEPPDILFIGSHCPGVTLLARLLQPCRMRTVNTGSTGGIQAIRTGTADIAGIHLLDRQGYNLPVLKRLAIKNALLVKGYLREQGIITRQDSDIQSLEDLIGKRIINRNQGSGTRILLDLKLKQLAKEKNTTLKSLTQQIQGYNSQARTHTTVASAVKLGRADAGIAIRSTAEAAGLKFIKIAEEEYDFLIQKNQLETKPVQRFLNTLNSKQFKENLPPGLKTHPDTGKIISWD